MSKIIYLSVRDILMFLANVIVFGLYPSAMLEAKPYTIFLLSFNPT